MDELTRQFLLAPPPLADPADPYERVDLGTTPGTLKLVTRGGTTVHGEATRPARRVLRLRLSTDRSRPRQRRASAIVRDDLDSAPAETRLIDRGIELLGEESRFTLEIASKLSVFGASYELASGSDQSALSSEPLVSGLVQGGFRHAFRLEPHAAVYGGGESYQGPNLRGRVRRGVNVETHGIVGADLAYLNVPFYWSDSGWGVFAHTGAPTRADVGASHLSVFCLDVSGPELDLFLYSGEPREIISAHLGIVGSPGRFPDWALGVWTSRLSYLNAGEAAEILAGYEKADCPVAVFHIDAWQPGNVIRDLTTAWEVDRERWPAGWQSLLRDRGVHLSLWHNPYVSRQTAAGEEALEQGLVLRDSEGGVAVTNDMPERMIIDFTNPTACEWWRRQVRALVTTEGVSALKADFGEEIPPSAVSFDGRSGWEIRNEYALLYQRETRAALSECDNGEDLAMFCRSGTAGAQRFPCHWVGDSISSWEGLEATLRACVSLSLSGFAYVAHDVGGFWTPEEYLVCLEALDHNDPSCYTPEVDPELFVRWTQFGALSPVMRFHGCGVREPWAYPGEYGEAAVEACRLRRRLMPYLRRVSREVSLTSLPMMLGLPIAYPRIREARWAASREYLLGSDLLVAPVVRAGGQIEVWIPPGAWEGIAGAPDLSGPDWAELTLDLAQVPAWKRAGVDLDLAWPT